MLSLKKLTLTGAMILVMLAAPLAVVQADIPGLQPDDFNNGYESYDPNRWFADELDPEYVHNNNFFSQLSSGGESYLQITVPAGQRRSFSNSVDGTGALVPGSLDAPRVMQQVSDDGKTPFTVTAKFLTIPVYSDGSFYGIQGIVLKGLYSPINEVTGLPEGPYISYMRFSIDSTTTPSQVRPYGSWFYKTNIGWGDEDGGFGYSIFEPPERIFSATQDTPIWLKVDRVVEQIDTDYWSTFQYSISTNGTTWVNLTPRSQEGTGPLNRIRQTFVVTDVGVFAGTTGNNPAYTAKIDWVSITDTAPDNEDEDPPVSTYTLTTEVSPSGAGTISVNPNKAQYEEDESVTLTATANSGYEFQNWMVNGSNLGTNPTLNLEMDENKEVEAVFAEEPPPNEFTESVFLPMVMR